MAGRQLKAALALAGMDGADLAKALKKHRGTVSRWVSGSSAIEAAERAEVARHLGVRQEDIWGDVPQMTHGVSRETDGSTVLISLPLAAEVLIKVDEMRELTRQTSTLAEQIIDAMSRNRGIADDLQRSAERSQPNATRLHLPEVPVDHPGLRVAARRLELNMSPQELASGTGVSLTQLQKIEDGRVRQISEATQGKIAKALKTTRRELFGERKP